MTPYKRMEHKVDFDKASLIDAVRKGGPAAADTPWHRLLRLEPQCGFGQLGLCCRNCGMGPCRASFLAEGPRGGACGAPGDLMAARWLARLTASAAAIRLHRAEELSLDVDASRLPQPYPMLIACGMREMLYSDKPPYTVFGSKLYARLKRGSLLPSSPHRELIALLAGIAMGSEPHAEALARAALRLALADAWITSTVIAALTEGFTEPRRSRYSDAGSGVVILAACLDEDSLEKINKAVESLGVEASVIELACEWRGEHPVAADLMMQEILAYRGTVSVVAYKWPCVLPAALKAFREKGAIVLDMRGAGIREVVEAIQQAERRSSGAEEPRPALRFSLPSLYQSTHGLRVLAEALEEGRITGIVVLGGCGNPKAVHGSIAAAASKLIQRDILVLSYGCSAAQLAYKGLLDTSAAEHAGQGLAGTCKELGVPPVIHIGTCNTWIQALHAIRLVAEQLGMGLDETPAALLAVEASGERMLSTLLAAAASGLLAGTTTLMQYRGSEAVRKLLEERLVAETGGGIVYDSRMEILVDTVLQHIKERVKA